MKPAHSTAFASAPDVPSLKSLLLQYAEYNLWANETLMAAIIQLPEEKQKQEVVSSFTSLFKTVLHIWDAENIWWQRIKLQEKIIRPSENFSGNMKELASHIKEQDKEWMQWIGHAQDHALDHVFHYQNSKKEQFKQPVYQVLLHLFNHSSYHRGQLVTLLRQVGMESIPSTDFIGWSRKK